MKKLLILLALMPLHINAMECLTVENPAVEYPSIIIISDNNRMLFTLAELEEEHPEVLSMTLFPVLKLFLEETRATGEYWIKNNMLHCEIERQVPYVICTAKNGMCTFRVPAADDQAQIPCINPSLLHDWSILTKLFQDVAKADIDHFTTATLSPELVKKRAPEPLEGSQKANQEVTEQAQPVNQQQGQEFDYRNDNNNPAPASRVQVAPSSRAARTESHNNERIRMEEPALVVTGPIKWHHPERWLIKNDSQQEEAAEPLPSPRSKTPAREEALLQQNSEWWSPYVPTWRQTAMACLIASISYLTYRWFTGQPLMPLFITRHFMSWRIQGLTGNKGAAGTGVGSAGSGRSTRGGAFIGGGNASGGGGSRVGTAVVSTTGYVTTGSNTTGSSTTGSVTTGSVTTGSVTTGSVTAGQAVQPATQSASQSSSSSDKHKQLKSEYKKLASWIRFDIEFSPFGMGQLVVENFYRMGLISKELMKWIIDNIILVIHSRTNC